MGAPRPRDPMVPAGRSRPRAPPPRRPTAADVRYDGVTMARDSANRPEAKASRLFVAFAVTEVALDEVERSIEPWRGRFPKARWGPRDRVIRWSQQGALDLVRRHLEGRPPPTSDTTV